MVKLVGLCLEQTCDNQGVSRGCGTETKRADPTRDLAALPFGNLVC
jgi:hypothetical protein